MATQNPPESRNKFKNIVLVVLVLFVLMLMTTVVAYFVAKNFAGNSNKKGVEVQNYITYDAGEFLTNLADKGYIKLSLVYLLNNKDTERELEFKDSEIRDKIFAILRSKKHDLVKDNKGMEELRGQIKEALNKILGTGKINDVYFTSIIVN